MAALVGCSSAKPIEPSGRATSLLPSSSPAASEAAPPSSTPVEVASFAAAFSWRWQLQLSEGYRQSGKLAIGVSRPAPSATDLPNLQASDLSSCEGFDADKTAVIPFSLTLHNDVSFAQELYVKFAVWPASDRHFNPLIVNRYSDEPACHQLGDAGQGELWSDSWKDVPGNSSPGTTYGYILLTDYYSPAQPKGDREALSHTWISMPLSYRSDGAELIRFSGAGIQKDWVQKIIPRGLLAEFPLAGRFT